MDVCCRDHRDFPDVCLCIYGTCGMANTSNLDLFSIGIDVGMPLDPANRFNSEFDGCHFLLVLFYYEFCYLRDWARKS